MWTYGDWRTQGGATAQAARLALHLQEVTDKITADVTSGSYSRQSHPLIELLNLLQKQYDGLVTAAGAATGGGMVYGRFRAPTSSSRRGC